MNELNAKRIEFRNNRRGLIDRLSDISDDIDTLRVLRTIKTSCHDNVSQSELHALNHNIDALIIEHNKLQKQLSKLEIEHPEMNQGF